MTISAKVIADSINNGNRVTTLECDYPRLIHSEFMTHRVFSRNAASSRAIPIERMIEQATDNTVIPMWTKNQKGMQGDLVKDLHTIQCANNWLSYGLSHAVHMVRELDKLGIHKQNANRYLEPFQHIKVVMTATDFHNFFDLRLDGAAQPEIKALAAAMYVAVKRSEPKRLVLGEWHLPYAEDISDLVEAKKVSASCCAQVSYRRNDPSVEKALDIYSRLVDNTPPHYSPFEHQCRPQCPEDTTNGNLVGFVQLRQEIADGRLERGFKL